MKKFNIHNWQHKTLLKEQGFDDRLKGAMKGAGFSDEEQDDIMSRDVGSPFPGDDNQSNVEGSLQAQDLIEELREKYRNMSDEELDTFSKEMVLHFIDNTAAEAAVRVHFGKKMGPDPAAEDPHGEALPF